MKIHVIHAHSLWAWIHEDTDAYLTVPSIVGLTIPMFLKEEDGHHIAEQNRFDIRGYELKYILVSEENPMFFLVTSKTDERGNFITYPIKEVLQHEQEYKRVFKAIAIIPDAQLGFVVADVGGTKVDELKDICDGFYKTIPEITAHLLKMGWEPYAIMENGVRHFKKRAQDD